MILDTKNNLGRIPILNQDLLEIESFYMEKYNFYIVISNSRVIGSLGYIINENIGILKRFYIKKEYQKLGIGQRLYNLVYDELKSKNIDKIYAYLEQPIDEWIGSYYFYIKNGFIDSKKGYMEKNIK